MKLQYKIALISTALHVISLFFLADMVMLVLMIIFACIAVITVFAGKSQALNVVWLFSGLIMIIYAIFHAYRTIPGTTLESGIILACILQLVGALVGVIATTFALELKYE